MKVNTPACLSVSLWTITISQLVAGINSYSHHYPSNWPSVVVQLIKYYHANEDTPLFILTNTNYNCLLSLNKLVHNITIHSAFEAETLEMMSPALLLSHKEKMLQCKLHSVLSVKCACIHLMIQKLCKVSLTLPNTVTEHRTHQEHLQN